MEHPNNLVLLLPRVGFFLGMLGLIISWYMLFGIEFAGSLLLIFSLFLLYMSLKTISNE